ncbi:VENN motif pre-toxin domain-containing protein, partial [Moraxella cuniculi]
DIGFINNTKHKLVAALTGCISAEIAKNDCESAALGAMIGEMWADRKIDNPNTLTDKQRQQIINESRLAASFAAFIFDKDINTAANMASEAVRWNSTARIMLGHEWNQITDDADGTYAKEQLQAIKDIPDNLAELSENITYLKNSNNDFIICVRTTTQSCLPKQGQRYATQNEISEGYKNFILDIIPIPGGTSAKAVVKKSGRVVSEAVVNKPANNIGKNNANYRRDRHEKITAKGIQAEKVNELRKLFDENNASKSIKIGNKTLHQEANSSGLTRIFKGVGDEEVKRYFMDLTGQPLPPPRNIPNKGIVYVAKTPYGNFNLRVFASSANKTGSVWTIDIPSGFAHKSKRTEIKFLRK